MTSLTFRALSLLKAFTIVLPILAVLLSGSALAASTNDEQVRLHVERGKAAFGLGKFADAAEAYESAFALQPTAALLYNAAQAHRMAGHKERALELYQSYLRLYRDGPNRAESEQHVENLQKTLAEERRVATAPPNDMAAESEPEPVAATLPVTTPAPQADDTANAGLSLTTPATQTEESGSITSSPWFWVGVGGVVVAATAVVLALTLGGSSDGEPRETIMGN